jgi:hypothetical protein
MSVPVISAAKTKKYEIKQSKYFPNVPEVPFRSVIVAPSGTGKTVLLTNLITEVYPVKKIFERYYIFSHSVNLDDAWQPVRRAFRDADLDPNQYMFDEFSNDHLEEILDTQRKVIEHQKGKKDSRLFSICIVLDDLLDDHQALRGSKALEMLFIRGRHLQVSCLCSVQKYRAVAPVLRINSSDDIVFKIRNKMDLDAILEEFSALAPKKSIEAVYRAAVDQPYGFLWINKRAKRPEDFFVGSFKQRLIPR